MRLAASLLLTATLMLLVSGAGPDESIEVHFSPNGGCTDAIVREIDAAQTSVRIQAYSFTSTPIAKAVVDAHRRGIQVQAILDKSNRTAKYSAATFLANQGVPVLIDDRHKIAHNKIIIIDARVIITGSFNFSKAAEKSNAENLLVIRGHADLATKYLLNYEAHRTHSEPYAAPKHTRGEAEKRNSAGDGFVGSKNSQVYHYPDCTVVGRIKPTNLRNYKSAPQRKRLHKGCPTG
jgi:phosphatidylserine/phosphatidylglycerophosphate/cardiolipin synthase-like enzyme